ncbi:MAG: 2-succinyl-5-enolpyruvyl-6-hydroxy-3-cyclohexene-1-carboxylic-acid synthase [Eggerthellaceae bacterium]|jgi:2-succinyl-5-enolpyruvyl-6-hydroxy-3-cyclohexene-1-carboxylate synthase
MTDQRNFSADRPQRTALFLSAFFDELRRNGMRQVVISPGSRSTPLSMVAYESPLDVFVDVDERGAAFFALGLAKASGHPVGLIGTSGTAIGNYLPAVLEAETSRVPLVVLSSDRPLRLQGLGAPQTTDQLKLFGDHVRQFREMPEPMADPASIAFARQAAREAIIAAAGFADAELGSGSGSLLDAAPVQVNFPLDEPLKPDLTVPGLFSIGRIGENDRDIAPRIGASVGLAAPRAWELVQLIAGKRVVAVCGERSFSDSHGRRQLLAWAQAFGIPLLADPLSQLRSEDDGAVIEGFDAICGRGRVPAADVVIRFGRWPISKKLRQWVRQTRPLQIVVDIRDTRDETCSTDVFARVTPGAFVDGLMAVLPRARAEGLLPDAASLADWQVCNGEQRARVARAAKAGNRSEAAYVARLIDEIPDGSLLFSGNSMEVRLVDLLYPCRKACTVIMANRGLNGIDGTLSTAFGAAQSFDQTTVLVGDLTMLHDVNALALQGEMLLREKREGALRPAITVVCLNNNGGAIFDMLPQQSDDPYFERLFLTPQQVDFGPIAQGFGVPYSQAETVEDFAASYRAAQGVRGISLIEVKLPLRGVEERYAPYWG